MKKVQFSVAAKAARLIGRENIADVDGALIELIKNAYDADASCVLVKMDIPFPDIPNRLDLPLVTKLLTEKELSNVLSCYTWRINQLVKRTDLSEKEQENLKNILFAYNKIIIADNGYGMTENIVSTTWMHIGTSDKEENVVSPNGRIKTGAKGIGRFALDKLSQYSLMYTKSKESSAVIKWSMNWEQFANAKLIDDVKAEIREVKNSYKDYIQKEFEEYKEVWNEHAWDTGTMIILNPIREPWSKRLFKKVNTNLNSILKNLNILEEFDESEINKIKSVGPYHAEMYFLRNAKSSGYDIMKKVATRKRRELLKNFSGIKIYRDDFKVRPYGDEGPLYDWLGLGSRAQKSPAPIAHLQGRWRVEPYQMIGWVEISRKENPRLQDMANREGIALTDTYYAFVSMLQKAIDEFEYDRQYIYREYARWIKSIENELGDYAERVKEEAYRRGAKEEKNKNSKKNDNHEDSEKFTEEELFGTVQKLVDEAEDELKSKQIIQVLSSSGIILNTFFHEFNAINTQFHIQAPQIRSRVNYILGGKEYTGLPAYNPYTRIDILEKNDKLTAAFLDVIMEGLKKDSLKQKDILLHREIVNILENWKLMIEDKHILIRPDIFEEKGSDIIVNMSIVDLYIILNNFLLNSCWFLEQEHNPNREIWFELYKQEKDIYFIMENNGPVLDYKYKNNPDKIFEIGETSKGKSGTGLGLWVVKETVERNNGNIEVLERNKGFGLKVIFKGMVKDGNSNRDN